MSEIRRPSYRILADGWRRSWLIHGCPEHDCREERVQFDHMLYAVCGVCGAVEGETAGAA